MQQAIHHFQIMSQPVNCRNFGHGQINYTFLITTDNNKQYILQRINTHVFKKPIQLMDNVIAVTEHIRSKVEDPNQVLHFIPALDGKYYYRDEKRRYWRCYEFVGGFCLEAPESDADFYESAVAFGRFQEQLSDFPAGSLFETIPNFHNTPDRYRKLRLAMDEDACDRLQYVQKEIDFILDTSRKALKIANPEIMNSDQGSHFTSPQYTRLFLDAGSRISMDHRGRAYDNIFVERLWRTIKYEEVYVKAYETPREARIGINSYMRYYNHERPHSRLGYRTPEEIYWGR